MESDLIDNGGWRRFSLLNCGNCSTSYSHWYEFKDRNIIYNLNDMYQGEKPDVSAIVAKIKGIKPTEPVKPVEELEKPVEEVGVKVVDLGKGDKGSVQVAGYDIYVTNMGATDPGIWLNMTDLSYSKKDIKVVCTSHPEWNKNNRMLWDGTRMIKQMDVWNNSFKFYKDGYWPVEPKSGDRVTFDVYGKVDGAEVKLATITKTLP